MIVVGFKIEDYGPVPGKINERRIEILKVSIGDESATEMERKVAERLKEQINKVSVNLVEGVLTEGDSLTILDKPLESDEPQS